MCVWPIKVLMQRLVVTSQILTVLSSEPLTKKSFCDAASEVTVRVCPISRIGSSDTTMLLSSEILMLHPLN